MLLKSSLNNLGIILVVSSLIGLIIYILYLAFTKFHRENFASNTTVPVILQQPPPGDNGILSEPMDRTKLYGSLFLDGLDKVIKNMSDPQIKYDTKRIEIVRYSDVLE